MSELNDDNKNKNKKNFREGEKKKAASHVREDL